MVRKSNRFSAMGLALGLSLTVAACAEPQEPAYYVLGQGAGRAVDASSGATTAAIGLRELALPLYVRRTQIAAVGPDGAITMSDDHRWAEDPPRAVSRVVARTLTALTGRPVVIEPWPIGIEPSVRIDIEVDYFAGALGGQMRLSGQYRIVRRSGEAPVAKSFDLTETSAGPGYDALVDSHTRALEALARLVAQELR